MRLLHRSPVPNAPAAAPADGGAPPTPASAYALAVLVALIAAVGICFPKAGVLMVVLGVVALGVSRIIANPVNGLVAVLCIYPLCPMMRAAYNAYGLPVFTSGVRLFPEMIQALILVHLLVRAAKERRPLRLYRDDVPVLVYIVGVLYSVVIGWVNVHPAAPINGWFVSVTPFVYYLLVRWIRPSEEQGRRLLRTFLWTYGILAVLSLADYFTRPMLTMRLYHAERQYFVPAGWDPWLYWKVYPRMQSLIFEENVWACLSTLVTLLCVANLMARRVAFHWWALLALSFTGIALSMSRGALVCLAVGGTVLLLLRGRHRPRVLALIALVAVIGAGLMVRFGQDPKVVALVGRLGTIGVQAVEKGTVASDRTHQWKSALETFEGYPSGTGLGTQGYAAHLSKVATHTVGDGIYFRVLAEQGVPGMIAFLFTLCGVAWVLWRYLAVAVPEDRILGSALLAFHAGLCVQSIGANTFDFYYLPAVYWMLVGLYVHRVNTRRRAVAETDALSPYPAAREP